MNTYQIKNTIFKANINAIGAEITSLILLNKNIELIWNAQKNIWPRHAPVLFPIVGKLKNNSINIKNQYYQLSQHGFARDLPFEILEIYTDKISLVLNATPETLKMWPFEFRFIITYQLTALGFCTTYTIINTDNEKIPFSVGGHPGYMLPSHNLDEYYIKINTQSDIVCHLLNEGLLSEKNYLISNSNIINLHNEIFKNDALIFKNIDFTEVELIHKESSFKIKQILKGFKYYGIWNKYPSKQFICLEPWAGITDSDNSTQQISDKEGIIWLEPNDKKIFEFITEFYFE